MTDVPANEQNEASAQPQDHKNGVSRRQFLMWTAGATAVAAGIGVPVVLSYVDQVRDLPLPTSHVGYLEDDTRRTLLALVEAIFVDYTVDLERYGQFLTMRANHVPGYRDLYVQFQNDVDRIARPSYGLPFADTKIVARRRIIAPWFFIPQTRTDRMTAAVTRGVPWLTYSQRIFKEILTIFMRTDAWLAVGYDAYPGMPRGLENYQKAIEPITT